MAFNHQVRLSNTLNSLSLVLNADHFCITEILIGNTFDRWRHSCREQRALTIRWRFGQNRLNIIDKAHAQHLIGFIQNQPFDVAEVQTATTQMIEHTTRGTHNNLSTALQTAQLATNVCTTVDRQNMETFDMFGIALERLSHLNCQLTSRSQNQNLR